MPVLECSECMRCVRPGLTSPASSTGPGLALLGLSPVVSGSEGCGLVAEGFIMDLGN